MRGGGEVEVDEVDEPVDEPLLRLGGDDGVVLGDAGGCCCCL